MAEINLLKSLPKGKRNVKARETAKTSEHIKISREYGEMYFDGPREYGYGGYSYDGRWKPVAKDIIEHFSLKPGSRILDIGCAKGFLVKDLLNEGMDAYGLDISEYAIRNCEEEVIGRLHCGQADKLPFKDNSFDAIISINTIHNYDENGVIRCLKEIQRLSNGTSFIQVDSYRTPEEKEIFESWVLTAYFHDYPDNWIKLFNTAGYTGDYYWTII